ncbi:MAG: DUF3369 domain-containing protein [Myxococcota bacterium]
MSQDDELFACADDDEAGPAMATPGTQAATTTSVGRPWKVLIVDDDLEVHSVTRLAISRIVYKGRGLELLSAHSGAEGAAMLRAHPDVALVLLDVVMETDDAGLRLVELVRKELELRAPRIVLRTGQPGQAPEEKIILDYDINDYKSKTELTSRHLFTTVVAALRAYEDIVALEKGRRGLRQIIDAADSLLEERALRQLASGVLTQLAGLLGVAPKGLFCLRHLRDEVMSAASLQVLAAAGPYEPALARPLFETHADHALLPHVLRCLETKQHQFTRPFTVLYIERPSAAKDDVVVCIEVEGELDPIDVELCSVFAAKIARSVDNVTSFEALKTEHDALAAKVAARERELEQMNEQLELLSAADVLTGVANRRSFHAEAQRAIAYRRRYRSALSIALVDVDGLQEVNARYGSVDGDEALRHIVRVCQEQLRTNDVIGRLGGEEFGVLLPECDLAAAHVAAERLRVAIEAQPVALPWGSLPLTVSIGVSEVVSADDQIELPLKRCESALQDAKAAGKNRCAALSYAAPELGLKPLP